LRCELGFRLLQGCLNTQGGDCISFLRSGLGFRKIQGRLNTRHSHDFRLLQGRLNTRGGEGLRFLQGRLHTHMVTGFLKCSPGRLRGTCLQGGAAVGSRFLKCSSGLRLAQGRHTNKGVIFLWGGGGFSTSGKLRLSQGRLYTRGLQFYTFF
jgi:hypothetical protein